LSDLTGQIVVLDFWASWCPPCVESLPRLGRLYGKEQDSVQVLAINLMEDRSEVTSFAASQNVQVPIRLDTSGEVAQKYNVGAIPQTVLIGPDGQIEKVFVGLGPDMYAHLAQEIQRVKEGGAQAKPAAAKTP
jgi:thiol-disulfide isomerase/thioredoxin